MTAVSVVVPALNERSNLDRLIPELAEACMRAGLEWEALIVDSDSEDGTQEMAARFAETLPVRLLNEPVRGDLARAWRRGIEAARYPVIVTMDADMCHSPAFVPDLAAALEECDMAIASRYHSKGRQMRSKPLLFEAVSRGGQWLCRMALRLPLTDMTHGFRAFRREMYDSLRDSITTPGNAFMVALSYQANRRGFSTRELPYRYGVRMHGEEHMNVPVEIRRFLAFIFAMWRKA
jgi:dolichol-phosphate mannosyltransferase